MDLIKEFKNMEQAALSYKDVLGNMKQEQVELEKRIHVFKVLDLAKELAEIVDSGLTENFKVSGFKITHYTNTTSHFLCEFLNLSGKVFEINMTDSKRNILCRKIDDLFNDLNLKSLDNASNEMQSFRPYYLPFQQGIDKQIMQMLLSDELKSMLEYSKMQVGLEKKEVAQKKIKI